MSEIVLFVGCQIRAIRTSKGMSQARLAKNIGVATNTVSRWETGVYKISLEQLHAVAVELCVSMSDFLPDHKPAAGNASLALRKMRELLPDDFVFVLAPDA